MPEGNLNSEATQKQKPEPIGPIVGIVIIMVIMVVGAVYVLIEKSKHKNDNPPAYIPGDQS